MVHDFMESGQFLLSKLCKTNIYSSFADNQEQRTFFFVPDCRAANHIFMYVTLDMFWIYFIWFLTEYLIQTPFPQLSTTTAATLIQACYFSPKLQQ